MKVEANRIRAVIVDVLSEERPMEMPSDEDSLFLSGRLSSLAVLKLICRLEETYGFQVGGEFNIERFDTVQQIIEFVQNHLG